MRWGIWAGNSVTTAKLRTWAWQRVAAARTEVKCCAASPGFLRLARRPSMRTG
jgi:hypothetical protein